MFRFNNILAASLLVAAHVACGSLEEELTPTEEELEMEAQAQGGSIPVTLEEYWQLLTQNPSVFRWIERTTFQWAGTTYTRVVAEYTGPWGDSLGWYRDRQQRVFKELFSPNTRLGTQTAYQNANSPAMRFARHAGTSGVSVRIPRGVSGLIAGGGGNGVFRID